MKLLLVRHAQAEDSAASDEARNLTPYGKESMLKLAGVLAKACPKVELIVSSPYVRAVQTAGILNSVYPSAEVRMISELTSDTAAEEALQAIKHAASSAVTACVGHEPNISALASLCLAPSARPFIHMGTGSAALVEFPGRPMKASGELLFLISPSALLP